MVLIVSKKHLTFLLLLLGFSTEFGMVFAQEYSPQQLEFFERQIRPLLLEHCVRCHGPAKQEGGFNLSTRESFLKGGDSGTALVVGKPGESLLIEVVEYLGEPKMPPNGKLTAGQIEMLRRWVEAGAAWTENSPLSDGPSTTRSFQVTEKQQRWWAFQPIQNPVLPAVRATEWPHSDLDRFVLAKLEAAGLEPAPAAERGVWLRRATYDLTGLPPTPEEIEAFQIDTSDQAFEIVVERLLNSPAYGQRWARHWLDVVRYADYHDFNPKARVASCEITEAWRYRDWVVDAFNRDLPFDEFIVHQIAGDQLPSPIDQEVYADGLVATTFLSNGVWDRGDADKEKIVSDMVDDNIGVIGKAFLGLTLECARCHDHKFDPISTQEYYALAGIFYSSHILKELGAKGGEYHVNRVPLIGPSALQKRKDQEKSLEDVLRLLAEIDAQHRFQEWTSGGRTLVPADFQSEAGAIGSILEDGSISVRGKRAEDVYRIEAIVPEGAPGRYLFLEALPDPDSPTGGSGRAEDGNFVITRLSASFATPDNPNDSIDLRFVSARADFEQSKFSAKGLLDQGSKAGWAIAPQQRSAHVCVFELSPEITIPAGSRLRVTMEQKHSDQHTLGKFRLSVADRLTTTSPAETDQRCELITACDRLQRELAVPVPLAMAVTEGGTAGGLFPGIQDVPIHIRGSYAKLGPVVPRGLPRFFAGDHQPTIARGSGRRELADWVSSRDNPLTPRVIVNRIWHWHFGDGLVRTPNNFGLLSEPPTHPELLDWLANRFVQEGWSLKKLHRSILLSATYRQQSRVSRETFDKDPENRFFGRFAPRRLEAEAIRDAMVSASGQIDHTQGGPAGDDFTIHRRSLYVQTARWQRDSYANLFDAANPDSSTERRVTSTVAPQALLLLNHAWIQEQAKHLAERLMREVPTEDKVARVDHAYKILFGRAPRDEERVIAFEIIDGGDRSVPNSGWTDLAHLLLCSNEFVYID